jgi:hypothetical protein
MAGHAEADRDAHPVNARQLAEGHRFATDAGQVFRANSPELD